jgi:hypothetical protein
MDTAIDLALTAGWFAFGVLLAYHVFDTWRRGEPLPFFRMLERDGLSVTQAEQAAGKEAFAAALRRCELCSDKKVCARALAADCLGRGPLACPNARFWAQVKAAEVQSGLRSC